MEKYKIFLVKKTDKGEVSRDVSMITAGKMVTRHNNPNDTFRIFKEKKGKKENVDWKRGILIEHFKDKSANEIKDHVESELILMRDKLGKDVEIFWDIEKC